MSQVSDEDLLRTLDPESNSIAHLIQHLSGNMQSRWTNFLTTDGEKPSRKRDSEFIDSELMGSPAATRAHLLELWETGWRCLFNGLQSITPDDLDRTVRIRSEPHSVARAIQRH